MSITLTNSLIDLMSMSELVSCGAFLGNTPLQHSMVVKDGASAEAIWGDGTSF